MVRIIYDVGSNNGDDIPYYLKKADLVVAVEANPDLVREIRSRFHGEIASGRLAVEGVVVTTDDEAKIVPFYLHKQDHVRGQFVRPSDDIMHLFDAVELPSRRFIDIVKQYGTPYYIKIDIEEFDDVLLADLFASKIFPPYISAESHNIEVFSTLVSAGKYNAFKLVEGPSIPELYGNHQIATERGHVVHSFPGHSAGPFGNDIPGAWQSRNQFFKTLSDAGLGWKDIHASSVDYAG